MATQKEIIDALEIARFNRRSEVFSTSELSRCIDTIYGLYCANKARAEFLEGFIERKP